MTRKEQNAVDKADFRRRCLEYRLRCIQHALPLFPLPEFQTAVCALQGFHDGSVTRDQLAKIYKDLKKLPRKMRSVNGDGEEFFVGLRTTLYLTLWPRLSIGSWDCQRFAEARFNAAWSATPRGSSGRAARAQREEDEFQTAQWNDLFEGRATQWQ